MKQRSSTVTFPFNCSFLFIPLDRNGFLNMLLARAIAKPDLSCH